MRQKLSDNFLILSIVFFILCCRIGTSKGNENNKLFILAKEESMSANVETMFYTGQVPWHGQGTKIDDVARLSPGQALVQSGLDWHVDTEKVFLADGREMPCRATVRQTDKKILGWVGPKTVPFQNESLVEFFRPFVESDTAYFHTGGSLEEGKKVWMLCQINKAPSVIAKDDEVAKFILLSNSHDGTTAIRVGFTPIRVVCANTLAFAHNSNASKLIRVRHSQNAVINLDGVRDTMNAIDAEFETTADKYRWLASRQINSADLEKYVKIVMGVTSDDDMSTRTKNKIQSVLSTIHSGPGQDLSTGTYWWAYNGFNAYLNHESGRNEHNRLNSIWFGNNVAVSKKALDVAEAMAA